MSMVEPRNKAFPVIDGTDTVVGAIARQDILRALEDVTGT